MRALVLILMTAMPVPAAAKDCGADADQFAYAYRAYNECSAAGKGAAGCAGATRAYDTARARLESCRQRERERSRPSWESTSGYDRDDDRRTRVVNKPRRER